MLFAWDPSIRTGKDLNLLLVPVVSGGIPSVSLSRTCWPWERSEMSTWSTGLEMRMSRPLATCYPNSQSNLPLPGRRMSAASPPRPSSGCVVSNGILEMQSN